jgi:hypothetical protein
VDIDIAAEQGAQTKADRNNGGQAEQSENESASRTGSFLGHKATKRQYI